MIDLVYWAISSGFDIEVRSSRKRVAIYAGVNASRRTVLGVDEAGVMIFGVPLADRPAWEKIRWEKILLASDIRKSDVTMDVTLYNECYIGCAGIFDKQDKIVIWMPLQDERVWQEIRKTSGRIKSETERSGSDSLIRLVCYDMVDGMAAWMPGEDIGICEMVVLRGSDLGPDVAWETTGSGKKAAFHGQAPEIYNGSSRPAGAKSSYEAKSGGGPKKSFRKSKSRSRSR